MTNLEERDPNPVNAELSNPLAFAVAEQDRHVIELVRDAIARRDVVLAYQPVMQTARPDRPAFYEGLIRVRDETGRIIPARDFIETVELTELGRKLDCLALEMGLAALMENAGLRLSINMSARSIGYPGWMKTLNRGLAVDETIADRLILEITESSAMYLPDLVTVFMEELQARGVTFALDDFGAGYTSFRYLREFYFDIIKIDGQFVRGVAQHPDNQALMKSLLDIARHFEMFTVAESVETAADAEYLTKIGLDCLQGYYFGAPTVMPPWRRPSSAQRRSA
ncbi:diguanylate phosphodiesterase [Thioclava dalianensis]|uniref:Diguanylate phosphodiesterase n=1 Tax=Thioclava dalianensis TaxID=1185766 RepID=A0A074TM81_9RHOB|nr:EAL domain-containing protein [Thioclava dalianensis]KEP71255.1 diguanylate phosphodiesterase [Thioclava dalianensis]SFM75569.1 EAL domain, c-di-GMP-specific phosphodiesterase class I (or its enzymatically inactive variant) [Thioclava dalianensis]